MSERTDLEIWNALLAANSIDAVMSLSPHPTDWLLVLSVAASMHGVEVSPLSDDEQVVLSRHIERLKHVEVQTGDGEYVPAMQPKETQG